MNLLYDKQRGFENKLSTREVEAEGFHSRSTRAHNMVKKGSGEHYLKSLVGHWIHLNISDSSKSYIITIETMRTNNKVEIIE